MCLDLLVIQWFQVVLVVRVVPGYQSILAVPDLQVNQVSHLLLLVLYLLAVQVGQLDLCLQVLLVDLLMLFM